MNKNFKFKSGDELYYVDPFIYSIFKVRIVDNTIENNEKFYIDDIGAYLLESNVIKTLDEAKKLAIKELEYFYSIKIKEIINTGKEGYKL